MKKVLPVINVYYMVSVLYIIQQQLVEHIEQAMKYFNSKRNVIDIREAFTDYSTSANKHKNNY